MPRIPSVSIYIRITDKKGRRHYERVKERNPQQCARPKDEYSLLFYKDGKQKWLQVGTDINQALNLTSGLRSSKNSYEKYATSLPSPRHHRRFP